MFAHLTKRQGEFMTGAQTIRPFWFIPSHGDGRWLGSAEGARSTDFGYLAAYTAHEVIAGKITGKSGESFKAGHLGVRKVIADKTIILSKPIVFTKANIDQYHF